MQFLKWESGFDLGIEEFDNHHKHLVEILNKAYRAVQLNDKYHIASLLNELTEYSKYHFSAEEEMMRSHHDPELADHAKEHELFISHISSFTTSLNSSEPLFKIPVVSFLQEWFVNHVLTVDRGYLKLFH